MAHNLGVDRLAGVQSGSQVGGRGDCRTVRLRDFERAFAADDRGGWISFRLLYRNLAARFDQQAATDGEFRRSSGNNPGAH